MNQLVTLITFTYVHETSVLKSRLESEGIYCQVKNEHTLQVHQFLSNAVGGVQLQVLSEDYPRAVAILREMGIEPELPKENDLLKSLVAFSRKLPFGQSLHPFIRLLIISALVLSVLVTALFTLLNYTTKSTAEQAGPSVTPALESMRKQIAKNPYAAIDSYLMEFPEQILALIDSLELAGTSENLREPKAFAHLYLNHYREALTELHAAPTLQDPLPVLWYSMATCHLEMQQYDSAEFYFQKTADSIESGYFTVLGTHCYPPEEANCDFSYDAFSWYFYSLIEMGDMRLARKSFSKALDYFKKAERCAQHNIALAAYCADDLKIATDLILETRQALRIEHQ